VVVDVTRTVAVEKFEHDAVSLEVVIRGHFAAVEELVGVVVLVFAHQTFHISAFFLRRRLGRMLETFWFHPSCLVLFLLVNLADLVLNVEGAGRLVVDFYFGFGCYCSCNLGASRGVHVLD